MNPLVAGSNPAGRISPPVPPATSYSFGEPHVLITTTRPQRVSRIAPGALQRPSRAGSWIARALTLAFCTLHGWAIWQGMGGAAQIGSVWPLARHDHPLYFHSALVTRSFLKQSGTTAGYDPSFMAGYAKSVVWPSSSTLPELAVALFGGSRPERAYKVYVLLSAALAPWLVWAACAVWRLRPAAATFAVLAFLIYVWTDFP
ncbi:MAG TPA: hypothetical protein VGY53_00130, partial [Isosphaeraceae bacterium]|nr:hypothetical protein [Isosphaeraceae bacterium]